MDPPTYDEARLHPPALGREAFNIPPPPSYDASLSSPSTPPPTYGEAVTLQPNPFPVLTPPVVPTTVTSPSHNPGVIIHPTTQIGITNQINGRQPVVVVTQPQSSPSITVPHLTDTPAVVQCPHCHRVVTTKVTYTPGSGAWAMCILIAVMGLICGFCLIPLAVRGLQDVHHSCPQCKNHIHTYKRGR
ncbi:lipopolysaccharide-induced tumor necrosis factor-alpha factor [Aulostomus maculatus]